MSKEVTMNVGDDGIAVLTLDVQGKPMNVITPELQQDLRECVQTVSYTHLTLPTNREV